MGKAFTNQSLWAAFLKKDIYLILDMLTVNPQLRRLTQECWCKFKATLGYSVRPYL